MSGFLAFLSTVLGAVFENVLAPVLMTFLQIAFKLIGQLISDFLAWLVYYIFTALLSLVGTLAKMFDFFAGTSAGAVTVNGQQTTVLEAIMGMSAVTKIFGVFTILGMFLAVIFSIINAVKSMSDMTLENKNPISKVMSNALKAFIMFALVPILCMFLGQLSKVVLNTIEESCKDALGSENTSVDTLIWLNCSYNAANDKYAQYNLGNNSALKNDILSGKDQIRKKIVSGVDSYAYAEFCDKDYDDIFDFKKFDYIQGIICTLVTGIVMLTAVIYFIVRIFDLLVLFVLGPLFAATIANDGGEMFKSWKELFIAKYIGSFSMVFGMKLYLILVPFFNSGVITFTSEFSDVAGLFSFEAFIRLVFIAGTAYAVYASQSTIMRLFSIEAAESMNSSSMLVSGFYRKGVMAKNYMKRAASGKSNTGGEGGSSAGSSSGSGNAYRGGNAGGA